MEATAKTFMPAKPCKRGHLSVRYTNGGACKACHYERHSTPDARAAAVAYRAKAKLKRAAYSIEYNLRPEIYAKRVVRYAKYSTPGIPIEAPIRPRPEICEVCGGGGGKKGIAFDHCHTTGKFRGWLCHGCNHALPKGMTPTRLRALAAYLERITCQ